MPQIIVQARTPNRILGAVTLAERVVPTEQQDEHYIGQLIERVGWALIDAEQLESQTNNSYPDRPTAPTLTSRTPQSARTPGLAKHQRRRTRRLTEAEASR
jgi:hypothetical protein